jgi:hypothetical protein
VKGESMNKKYQKTNEIGNQNPFRVPEGYFDELASRIQTHLTEVEVAQLPAVTLWGRIKPWVYMVAMFVGIALMFDLFKGKSIHSDTSVALDTTHGEYLSFFEEENEEDVLAYFEYQAVESNYREIVYIGE